jgi:hypothetical protein
MSYKRFDQEDIVVSSDSITSPAWSDNVVNLTTAFTSSTQVGASSGNYYYNVYNGDPVTSTSASIQYSVAYGNRLGSGSALYDAGVAGKSYSSTVYGQFRTLIFGDEDTDFTFLSQSGAVTTTGSSVGFISVERARYKEKMLPGSMTLTFKSASVVLKLTDDSLNVSTDTFVDAGREYALYSGSGGSVHNRNIQFGNLYPDIGVVALNLDQMSASMPSPVVHISGSDVSDYSVTSNVSALYESVLSGSGTSGGGFTLRSQETVSSNYIFVRCRNAEFNYSNNPSNITGSGELRHSVMIDSPQSYITAVGLYNDNNDLLAVAKLSTPLLKDFTKEALIRIKLDY